ncbi:MAG: spermidine synthase [Myxococcota bacterium]|jgi:spermidine synthase|nr:spermidine synthase [Myxococcota bacterium]
MAHAWETLERVETEAGPLELRRRGEGDFLITVAGRVLMNSHANRSELALATLACEALASLSAPRLLLGGLGMGCTLRAALKDLPSEAKVDVVELNPHVADWCRGALAKINDRALEDPRVHLQLGDVSEAIADSCRGERKGTYDAILLDLYEGPHSASDPNKDPFYGSQALVACRGALAPGGLLAVWAEAPDRLFDQRMRAAGLKTEIHRPGRGGLRHAVHLGRRPGSRSPA